MKVIFYHHYIGKIGGIETFLFNLVKQLKNYYDIKILFNKCDSEQFLRLAKYVDIEKCDEAKEYQCDICIFGSSYGGYVNNIMATKYYQVLHADYNAINFKFEKYSPKSKIIAVSETVKQSFEKKYEKVDNVIYNLLDSKKEVKPIIKLISATRLTKEKGYNRMLELARNLKERNINFRWTIFTNADITPPYEEIQVLKPRYDLQDYIAEADYGVQLSDTEGWCYFINECLQYDTPVIVTDFDSVYETVKDGENGYILDRSMNNIPVDKIVNSIPSGFEYKPKGNINKWIELLGNPINKKGKERRVMVRIKALRNYTDMELDRDIKKDEEYEVREERANVIIKKGYADLITAKEEPRKETEDELQDETVAGKKKTNTNKR